MYASRWSEHIEFEPPGPVGKWRLIKKSNRPVGSGRTNKSVDWAHFRFCLINQRSDLRVAGDIARKRPDRSLWSKFTLDVVDGVFQLINRTRGHNGLVPFANAILGDSASYAATTTDYQHNL